MSRKEKAKIYQWNVPMRITFDTNVTVEAETESEARQKAEGRNCVDDGMKGAECVDWEITGKIECDELSGY